MGRGTGLAKLALGMGALRAANTAVHAAAWSSYPRYHSYYRPYGYYDYYDPYYYSSGYYGYGYGSSRGAGWFIAAVCVALIGTCCLLIPGIAGIICCGVGIAAALGLSIGGIVAANSTPDTVVVKEQSTQKHVEGNSQEQSKEQSQSQNKGNCAETPRAMAPKENQMCIAGKECHFAGYRVNTGTKEPRQMATSAGKTNFATKYKNKDNKDKQYDIKNKNAKFNQKNLEKQQKVVDMR